MLLRRSAFDTDLRLPVTDRLAATSTIWRLLARMVCLQSVDNSSERAIPDAPVNLDCPYRKISDRRQGGAAALVSFRRPRFYAGSAIGAVHSSVSVIRPVEPAAVVTMKESSLDRRSADRSSHSYFLSPRNRGTSFRVPVRARDLFPG